MDFLKELLAERNSKYKGGLYHRTQILFAYNSNHIEGTRLTEEQTRYILKQSLSSLTEKVPLRSMMWWRPSITSGSLTICWTTPWNLSPKP